LNPIRWIAWTFGVLAGLACAGLALLAFVFLLAWDNLPSIDALTDYRPKIPLRIYTLEGTLIGEFGEERRMIVRIDDVPPALRDAIIAAEDERFYAHTGIDLIGVVRAATANVLAGRTRQGASTITMQLARNLFLSNERTFTRKIYEALLAYRIETSLTKDQILETYINQIYLGQRAYGFAAAAQVYYGRAVTDLSLAEAAMLAGLPKAPSSYNPVVNPKRAHQRQLYVLRRMLELGNIDEKQHAEALRVAQVQLAEGEARRQAGRRDAADMPVRAEFVAEMVRQALFERYPEEVYARGLRVYTTISRADQEAAYTALRKGVLDFDRRQGYRGPENFVNLPQGAGDEAIEDALQDIVDHDDLLAAIVLEATPRQVTVQRRAGEKLVVDILRSDQRLAESLGRQATDARRIRRGSIVRVFRDADEKGRWRIWQLPEVEAAFVSMDPRDGAIRSLVGGFDFSRNKYNRVTQAWRQPGSSFKPFVYAAALDRGFTASTIVPDEPVVVDAAMTGGQAWEPKNYDGKFEGPMRVRTALAKSKNMVSIRILQAIGTRYAQDYITRFGFDADRHPPYLTMALGAGSVTPMQMARGYGVFANGGYRVEPYLISRIVDDRGNLLAEAKPARAGVDAPRVLEERNAFVMDNLMREVVRSGTATSAMSLGRNDLAGKTGTTNDYNDAWFAGYQSTLVGIAWVGYDTPKRLGNQETGGRTALPIWTNYMARALKGVPQSQLLIPDDVVAVKIDPDSGLADPDGRLVEYFYRTAQPRDRPVQRTDDEPPVDRDRRLF